ncbi:MAG: PilW family protein [Pseudomonas sp.]
MHVRHQGFSLVELMVAMALGLILVLNVLHPLLASKRGFVLQQHLAEVQENARFVLTRISRDLRQAGMFGCLDLQRLPAATRSQLPADFAEPIIHVSGVLKLLSAVTAHNPVLTAEQRNAAQYNAQWLLASDCLSDLRIASGSDNLAVSPGDVLIPVRQIEYRQAGQKLQARINGAGNFETLIEGVADFDVQFGLATDVSERNVAGAYRNSIAATDAPLIRSVRIALVLTDNPADPGAGFMRTQQYTLVTALRNRLD